MEMKETMQQNKEYLGKIFAMLKKMENVALIGKETRFNRSELRLLTEILLAKCEGKRLISTQLAKRLNVTRSAVSQIVNHMEVQGVVKRVPDEVDRKIAYIEFTGEAQEHYEKEVLTAAQFVGELVKELGTEKLDRLLSLAEEFATAVQEINEKGDKDA